MGSRLYNTQKSEGVVMRSLLNIGAGKLDETDLMNSEYTFMVFLDRSYREGLDNRLADIEKSYMENMASGQSYRVFCGLDIFEFMDSFKFKFNHIKADRIFEHMFYDSGEIGRLLDACNQLTTDDGTLEIIVPDHHKLATMLINYEPFGNNNGELLIINTEYVNTRSDPHGSIWTNRTAHEYVEAEGGTWQIDDIERNVSLKGRDIYMKIKLSKPKPIVDETIDQPNAK